MRVFVSVTFFFFWKSKKKFKPLRNELWKGDPTNQRLCMQKKKKLKANFGPNKNLWNFGGDVSVLFA